MGILNDLGLSGFGGMLPEQAAPRYTQDFLNIEEIVHGLIITKDKKYLKICEVKPINFFMRSLPEQDAIVQDFADWLMIAPVNLQIKIITQNGDPSGIVQRVKNRCEADKDEAVEPLVSHYCDLLEDIGGRGAITRKFYIVLSYEPRQNTRRLSEPYDISFEMDRNIGIIKGYFGQMGNVVTQFGEQGGFIDHDRESLEVAEFLYNYFNARTARSEGIRPATTFDDRLRRIYQDEEAVHGRESAINPPITSLLAPTGIDVTRTDCVVMDGMYYTTLAITGKGYPPAVYGGWVNTIIQQMLPGECIDFFTQKEDRKRFQSYISQKVKYTSIKLTDRNEYQTDYEQIESALTSARYLKDCLADGQYPFNVTTLITLCASKYQVLLERKDEFIDSLMTNSITLTENKYLQEEAVRSSFPLLSLSPKIHKLNKRNVMNLGLASFYPFTSYEMQDRDGFLLGLNLLNSTMCIMNPFDTNSYKNANMVLLGTSGAGKTYTEQLMALRLRELGTQVFILAPDKASEYKRACDSVDGSFIKISTSSKDHINIMDIRPSESRSAELLQGDALENTIYVAAKAQSILTFIELLIPDITNEEQQVIDSAIIAVYAKYGITEDNDSIYIDASRKEKGLKEMPILGDLIEEIKATNSNGKMDRIVNIMSQFTTGSAKSFNERTNVDLGNKYIVFDVSDLKNYTAVGMFIALDFIMGRVKEDVLERKMVFIDEGWQLIGGGSNEKAAQYVNRIFKTIRGYNGGAVIATQDIKDFFSLQGGKYGNAILSNSKIKILLQLEPTEAEFVREELKLTPEDIRQIKNFKRGYGMVCANSDHIPVNIIGSDYLTKLVTTDPEMMRQVVAEMERNGGKIV